MIDKKQMWEDVQNNERYAETLKQVAKGANLPFEDVVLVMEVYLNVSARRSAERIAERKAQEFAEESS